MRKHALNIFFATSSYCNLMYLKCFKKYFFMSYPMRLSTKLKIILYFNILPISYSTYETLSL